MFIDNVQEILNYSLDSQLLKVDRCRHDLNYRIKYINTKNLLIEEKKIQFFSLWGTLIRSADEVCTLELAVARWKSGDRLITQDLCPEWPKYIDSIENIQDIMMHLLHLYDDIDKMLEKEKASNAS